MGTLGFDSFATMVQCDPRFTPHADDVPRVVHMRSKTPVLMSFAACWANIGYPGSLNWNGRSALVFSSEFSPGLRSNQDFLQVGDLGLVLTAVGLN